MARRLRPRGMALDLLATAVARALVAVTALIAGLPLFSLSAWLFWRAAEQHYAVAVSCRA